MIELLLTTLLKFLVFILLVFELQRKHNNCKFILFGTLFVFYVLLILFDFYKGEAIWCICLLTIILLFRIVIRILK